MTCTCHSYNRPDLGGKTPEIIVDGVCLDACIAEPIKALWATGIQTGCSCCGHNQRPPTVMPLKPEDVPETARILSEVDDRQWHITVWSK